MSTLADAVAAADARLGAAAVAHAPEAAASAAHANRFVLFTIAATHYAVSESMVIGLERVPAVTLVPRVPDWVRGVANLRGDIVSVVDLRSFMGLEPTSPHTGRMLVVRLRDEELALGLLVDGVDQMATVDIGAIHPPASPLEGALAPFLVGVSLVGERLIVVLDLDRLLRSPEIRQFDDVKEDASCEAR
jgi:purine-binding chemotaxis protein CheW